MGRRVKVIKFDKIVYTHAFEHEDDVTDVRALDFGDGGLFEFFFVGP